jgi:sensor c-di-GMP phosphodiesterase-like protein
MFQRCWLHQCQPVHASVQGGLTNIPDQIGSAMKEQAQATQASAGEFKAPVSFWIGLGYVAVAVAVLVVVYAQTQSQSKQGSLNEALME